MTATGIASSRRRFRLGVVAGVAGPLGFLAVALFLAVVRHELIVELGWASWPSSMALGGSPGIAMILAFCWLGTCYLVFAFGALRHVIDPGRAGGIAIAGFVVAAAGDYLLAFPTDGPGTGTTWHGTLHLVGVIVATIGTLLAATGLTAATRSRVEWHPWRVVAPIPFVGAAIGLVAGFDEGWAKVVYVVLITVPAAVAARCVGRSSRSGRSGEP